MSYQEAAELKYRSNSSENIAYSIFFDRFYFLGLYERNFRSSDTKGFEVQLIHGLDCNSKKTDIAGAALHN